MGNFVGSPYNVSPLCQGCSNIEWADKQGYDFYQCEECKKTADEAREKYLKQHEEGCIDPVVREHWNEK